MAKRRIASRPDYIKWLLIIGAASLVALLGAYCVWRFVLPHSIKVDRLRYPIAGIDVSKHNGVIDFEQVAGDDYQFVIIKASEGKTYKDVAFERNYEAARAAGLKVGAYHFFRKNRTGAEQANNLLAAVNDRPLDLPLVIDVEDDWGGGAMVGRDTALKRVMEMVSCLKAKGHKVMIYTNFDGYKKYYKGMLGDCDLWLCSFNNPDLMTSTKHSFQQFSHEGQVSGVDGDVDLNVFCGSKREWNSYLASVAKK